MQRTSTSVLPAADVQDNVDFIPVPMPSPSRSDTR